MKIGWGWLDWGIARGRTILVVISNLILPLATSSSLCHVSFSIIGTVGCHQAYWSANIAFTYFKNSVNLFPNYRCSFWLNMSCFWAVICEPKGHEITNASMSSNTNRHLSNKHPMILLCRLPWQRMCIKHYYCMLCMIAFNSVYTKRKHCKLAFCFPLFCSPPVCPSYLGFMFFFIWTPVLGSMILSLPVPKPHPFISPKCGFRRF